MKNPSETMNPSTTGLVVVVVVLLVVWAGPGVTSLVANEGRLVVSLLGRKKLKLAETFEGLGRSRLILPL